MSPEDAAALLDLTVEYQRAVAARSDENASLGGVHTTREPMEIAADYARLVSEG